MAAAVERMLMSKSEADACCERIRGGMTSIGDELVNLYEREGWRAQGYSSFRECATGEFGGHQATLYRQLEAAQVARELEADPVFAHVRKIEDVSGRQLRALSRAPEGSRAEVLDVAVKAANGKPTEAVVKAAVDAKLARPKATPAELVKTVVNGVTKADRAIEKARAAGKIPAGVTVNVEDPGENETTVEEVAEEHAEDAAVRDEGVSDEEWVQALPLASKLSGVSLDVFKRDSLLFRYLEAPLRSFASYARKGLKAHRKGRSSEGFYAFKVSQFLRLQHPRDWKQCPPLDRGGCGGSGQVAMVGQCPKCKGRGYLAQ